MKIEVIICDICNRNINASKYRRYSISQYDPVTRLPSDKEVIRHKVVDICPECVGNVSFDKLLEPESGKLEIEAKWIPIEPKGWGQ